MKKYKLLLTLFAGFALAACSHENPLLTQPTKDSANFVVDASTYAEGKLDYRSPIHGRAYGECVMGHITYDLEFCPKLFDFMVKYARKSGAIFHSISKSDLQDKKSFFHIENDYLDVIDDRAMGVRSVRK